MGLMMCEGKFVGRDDAGSDACGYGELEAGAAGRSDRRRYRCGQGTQLADSR